MNQTFGHVLELDFILTLNVMLVQFLSVTGYGQKIKEGDMADGLTIRQIDTQTQTDRQLFIVGCVHF